MNLESNFLKVKPNFLNIYILSLDLWSRDLTDGIMEEDLYMRYLLEVVDYLLKLLLPSS